MPVYDDEINKTGTSDDDLRQMTGISPDEEDSMEASAVSGADQDEAANRGLSGDELAAAEASGDDPEQTDADEEESDQLGGGYTDEPNSTGKRKAWLTRKKAVTGGIAGLLIGGGIGIFSIVQGPLQLVHFSQLLDRFHFQSNSDFSNSRTNKLLRYMRNKDHPERRRLGFTMNKIADRVEKRWKNSGFEIEYERNDGGILDKGRIKSIRVGPDVDVSVFERDGIRPSAPDAKGFRTVDFSEMTNKKARKSLNKVSTAAGHNRVISAVSSRILAKRAGVDFHPFKDKKREANQRLADYYKERKQERAERRKRGVTPPQPGDPDSEKTRDTDEDGVADSGDPDADKAAQEARDALGDIGSADLKDPGVIKRLRSSLLGKIGGSVTAAVGILCTVKSIGDQAEKTKYANIILPMLRMGGEIITTGSQVMAGQGLNMDEVGSIVTDLYDASEDEDEATTPNSWVSAQSIQAELGQEQTGPDLPDEAKPGRVGEKPKIFQIIDGFPGIGGICGVSNFISNLPIIKQIGDLTGAAINAVIPVDKLISALINLIAGGGVNVFAQGAELGNIANYGSRLASNDQAIGMGGQQLEENEEQELDREVKTAAKEEFQKLSLKDKLFSVYNTDSLLSQVAIRNSTPTSPSQAFSQLAMLPMKIFPGVGNSFASLGTNTVAAQSVNNGYDYGFNMYGFTSAERDDTRNEPYAIATELDNIIDSRTQAEEDCERRGHGPHPPPHECDYVPSNIAEFNQLYEKCFGTRIIEQVGDQAEKFESLGATNYFNKPQDGGRPDYCETGQPDTENHLTTSQQEAANDLRVWRFYIADTIVGHSLACYEGIEESCNLFNYSGSASASASTSSSTPQPQTIQKYKEPLPTSGEKITPKGITLHWWGFESGGRGIDALAEEIRKYNNSVQFGITETGQIYQMTANEDDLATHAKGANATTFGIEIEGMPEDFGANGPTSNPAKFDAVVFLVKYLADKYQIPRDKITVDNIACGDVIGIHPHKSYNKCGNTKVDIDDAYYNAVMEKIK